MARAAAEAHVAAGESTLSDDEDVGGAEDGVSGSGGSGVDGAEGGKGGSGGAVKFGDYYFTSHTVEL